MAIQELYCMKCFLAVASEEPLVVLDPFVFHQECYQAHLRYLEILDRNRRESSWESHPQVTQSQQHAVQPFH